MSFDIQWSKICHDEALAASLTTFLNAKLADLALPHYLANLQVVNFRFGDVAPDITIRDIDVPFTEFYEAVYGDDDDDDDDDGGDDESEQGHEDNKGESDINNNGLSRAKSHSGDGSSRNTDMDEEKEREREREKEFGKDENDDDMDDEEEQYFDKHAKLRSRRPSRYHQSQEQALGSIPMAQSRPGSPNSSLNANPFINGPNALLMPRASSGIAPTLGRLGVGLGGLGGSGFVVGGGGEVNTNTLERDYPRGLPYKPTPVHASYDHDTSFSNIMSELSGVNKQVGMTPSAGGSRGTYPYSVSPQPQLEVNEQPFTETHPEIDTSLDLQLSVDFDWDSQLYIEIMCDLLVNYPAPEFIRLPVRLKMTDLKIHSLMTIAYIAKRVFISFLCDIEGDPQDSPAEGANGGVGSTESAQGSRRATSSVTKLPTNKGKDRIDILQDMKIEGEIGNIYEGNTGDEVPGSAAMFRPQSLRASTSYYGAPVEMGQPYNGMSGSSLGEDGNGNDNNGLVLRNIGKIEKFLITAFRDLMIDELAWPGWIELDFNETEEEVEDSQDAGEDDNSEDLVTSEDEDVGNSIAFDKYGDTGSYEDVGIDVDVSTDRLPLRAHRPRSTRPSFVQTPREKGRRPRSSQSFEEASSIWSSDSYFTSDNDSS
jgi:distribution and morphology protein 12